MRWRLRVAMGDPQAPFERVLAVLDAHALRGADGRLRPDVFLVSLGDHFDWGTPADRARADEDGRALLDWLAAHPADQVVILLGNHDLARVTELADFDDASFAEARSEADRLGKDPLPEEARRFHERWPALATTELALRDFSCFTEAQRRQVASLLRSRRARVAFAAGERVLAVHAGVTAPDLARIGLPAASHADAGAVASALNAELDAAVDRMQGDRLELSLHQPGHSTGGEGRGIFYHRASEPGRSDPDYWDGDLRRRFDPREMPPGLVQVVGHVSDAKCLELLAMPEDSRLPVPGRLRHLVVEQRQVRYGLGPAPPSSGAVVLFADGGMARAPAAAYELVDLDRLDALKRSMGD